MAEQTKIQWTHHTFNGVRGCTKVSAGCAHCYAERGSKRNPRVLGIWGNNGTRVLASDKQWNDVRKWNRQAQEEGERHRVFCYSLADVFEDWKGQMTNSQEVPLFTSLTGNAYSGGHDVGKGEAYTLDHARQRLWKLIRECPFLDFQLLTKRPEHIARMMPHGDWPNVWLMTSVESMDVLPRIDQLLDAWEKIEVPVRGISAEPLLGPLDLRGVLHKHCGINWVIVGGESGGHSRPCAVEWVRDIVKQCKEAGVAVFVKQLGANPESDLHHTSGRYSLPLRDSKGGDIEEWPADLRVREFPQCETASS